jgi:hypothetical protein
MVVLFAQECGAKRVDADCSIRKLRMNLLVRVSLCIARFGWNFPQTQLTTSVALGIPGGKRNSI